MQKYRSIWLLLGMGALVGAMVLALCFVHTGRLPDTVGRALTPAEQAEIIARNSPLTAYVLLSPNADFPRQGEVKRITIHHMAGDLGLEELGEAFAQADRRASATYAIDSAGRVALYVEEQNRPWTSSSLENDRQAVTIEVANDETGGEWHISDAALETLIDLCTDICRRNGIPELTYTGDDRGTLTTHKMFKADTQCPGPYLEGRLGHIAGEVTRRLKAEDQS